MLQEAVDLNAHTEDPRREGGSIRVAVAQNLAAMGRVDEAMAQLKQAFAIAANRGRTTASATQTAVRRIYPNDLGAIQSLSEQLISLGDLEQRPRGVRIRP